MIWYGGYMSISIIWIKVVMQIDVISNIWSIMN